MKITFTPFTASETVNVDGRPHLEKGEEIDVTRLEVKAYIPKTPQHTPLTGLHFWLSNGERYEILLAGSAVPISEKNGKTNAKTV